MRFPLGQLDLKPVLVAIVSSAVLGGFGYFWQRISKVDLLEERMARMEQTLERIEDRLPPKRR